MGVVACVACGQAESQVEQLGRCAALEGKRFASSVELECGLTPTGPALCRWQIEIRAGDPDSSTLVWRHSDVEETLRVTCNGAVIAASTPREVSGWFDDESGELTWDGLAYRE